MKRALIALIVIGAFITGMVLDHFGSDNTVILTTTGDPGQDKPHHPVKVSRKHPVVVVPAKAHASREWEWRA